MGSILWSVPRAPAPERAANRRPLPAAAVQRSAPAARTGAVAESAAGHKKRPPLPLRLGISYIAGFFAGYAFRRFFLVCFYAGLGLSLLFVILKLASPAELSWGEIQTQLDAGLSEIRSEAAGARRSVFNVLPSTTAALLGLVLGSRRKWVGAAPWSSDSWVRRFLKRRKLAGPGETPGGHAH